MDKTYTKLDLEILMDSDWSALENYFRIDGAGIWLLTESAPEFKGLTQDERDLFMIHPDGDRNFPVLPYPFTVKQFLKFAMLPVVELRDIYTFADETIDVVAIEKLERMHFPAGALVRALMFGELPKLAHLKEIQGDTTSAHLVLVAALEAPSGKKRASTNWKMQIQIEATARTLRLRQSGASPTRHSILGDMVKWCRDNNVKTDGKILPSAGYLRTHVLGGKHWDVPN